METLREELKMLDENIKRNLKIKQFIQEMEEEKWKEKQQDSYSRGQR